MYSTAVTGREWARHLAENPRPLEITGPTIVRTSTTTITVALNQSRVRGIRFEIATSAVGGLIKTSLNRSVPEGAQDLTWTFSGIDRSIGILWVRVIYWERPSNPITVTRSVTVIPPPVTPDPPDPVDPGNDALVWNDDLRWSDGNTWQDN